MTKKYFITGGSGFIGESIIKRLLTFKNTKVICFDSNLRGSFKKFNKKTQNLKLIKGDIRNLNQVVKASKGCDYIIHLAFLNGTQFFYSHPDLVLDIGVKGMINVIEASKLNKIKKFILASSSEVYQTPSIIPTPEEVPLIVPNLKNPRYSYGAGKIISEVLAMNNANLFDKMIIFRPHNVYGSNMGLEHVIPQLIIKANKERLKNKKYVNLKIIGDGNDSRAFNYIDDFTDGIIKIILKGKHKEVYNIGSNEKTKIKDLARLILNTLNLKGKIITQKKHLGSTKNRCPNINKIKKLGYSPKIKISKGIKIVIKWYIDNYKTLRKININARKI